MPKTINYNETVQNVTETMRDTLIEKADGWHDPNAGKEVNYIQYAWGSQSLTLSLERSDIGVNDVQNQMDGLATAINALNSDFGTVDEIKDDMSIT